MTDKTNIFNVSLGKTSACGAIMSQQMNGVFNCVSILEHCIKSGEITGEIEYILMDTGFEHPLSYEFGRNLEKLLGIKITVLQGDFKQDKGVGHTFKVTSLDDLTTNPLDGPFYHMARKYGVPTVMTAWCTSRMKEETHDKYCDEKYGKGNYITWLSMRIDEPARLKSMGKNPNIRYIAEISDMTKADVNDYWSDMPFNLDIEPHKGNCVFCVKKSKNKIALAARQEPELARQWQTLIDDAANDKYVTIKKNKDGQIDFVMQETGEPDEIKIPAKDAMYRGYLSFGRIIQMFSEWTDEEIKRSIRSMKEENSDGCSESCQPTFESQIDMFEG